MNALLVLLVSALLGASAAPGLIGVVPGAIVAGPAAHASVVGPDGSAVAAVADTGAVASAVAPGVVAHAAVAAPVLATHVVAAPVVAAPVVVAPVVPHVPAIGGAVVSNSYLSRSGYHAVSGHETVVSNVVVPVVHGHGLLGHAAGHFL